MAILEVEVVCAWPERHVAVTVALPEGATVGEAIRAAGIAASHAAVAVFGEAVSEDRRLRDGDRVELLRALAADPKAARRDRARRRTRS